VLLPILYLRGLSTGDFQEALAALLGKDAPGLSASTISRLKEMWSDEHDRWRRRDLSARRYVYVWAERHLPASPAGRGEAVHSRADRRDPGRQEGADRLHRRCPRECAGLARVLLLDLKRRGLTAPPRLAVADGALGFWTAVGELWPTTAEQRCWVHKTANVLNKLPKSQQAKAKRALQDIWMGATRKDAEKAFVSRIPRGLDELFPTSANGHGSISSRSVRRCCDGYERFRTLR
jgi:putative transposase